MYELLLLFLISNFSHALINGQPLSGYPDLVRLEFSNGWVCTGAYIDPYTILTAGHCLKADEKTFKLKAIFSDNEQMLQVNQREIIVHPEFNQQWWPSVDIGIVKTDKNTNFKENFKLEKGSSKGFGKISMFGVGRTQLKEKNYERSFGENSFLRIWSVLFMLGLSKPSEASVGKNTSVAPNDSGGPVIDQNTGGIIGIMTTTTVNQSAKYGLPALSTAPSTTSKTVLEFILKNLGPAK